MHSVFALEVGLSQVQVLQDQVEFAGRIFCAHQMKDRNHLDRDANIQLMPLTHGAHDHILVNLT